jgi:hypothetical protein
MRHQSLAWLCVLSAFGGVACGSEVPIGKGDSNVNGSGGSGNAASGGSAGSGAGAGIGAAAGEGGSAARDGGEGGSGGEAASGGTGGTGAVGGSGGVGGAGVGGGGTGGFTSCPVETSALVHQIAAPDVSDVLIVGSNVYFSQASATAGVVRRADLTSGVAVDFASIALDPASADAFVSPDSLASDGTNLYWRSDSGHGVWRKPIGGGSATLISKPSGSTPFAGSAGSHDALSVGQTEVFWVDGPHPSGTTSTAYRIYSAPRDGGTAKQLFEYDSGQSGDVPFMPLSIFADASKLYFTLYSAVQSKTVQAGLDGSNPTDLFGIGHRIADGGANVFLTAGSGFVWRLPKDGSPIGIVTSGLSDAGYWGFSQAIALTGGQAITSESGTVGNLECCKCGWISTSPDNATTVTPKVIWAGVGGPGALDGAGGVVVAAERDTETVLVLKP